MNKKNEDNAMFILFGANVECYWRCFFVILIPRGFFFKTISATCILFVI